MAEIEQALEDRLTGYAGLTALVGTRVYPSVAPQNPSRPYVVYRRVGGDDSEGMTTNNDLPETVVQIDVVAATYPSMKAVAAQVEDALLRWDSSSSTPVVLDVFAVNRGFDIPFSRETGEFQHSRDWRFVHRG